MPAFIAAARPYPWPYHEAFDPLHTALLVVVDDKPEGGVLERVVLLASAATEAQVLTVALSRPGGPTLPFATELALERPRLSGFLGTALDLELRARGRTDLLVTGFPLELGADCTMREANDLGYECLLVEDGCTAADRETFAGAVRSVQMSGGIFGAVATTDEVLALLRHVP